MSFFRNVIIIIVAIAFYKRFTQRPEVKTVVNEKYDYIIGE